jgi:hypothetical protein
VPPAAVWLYLGRPSRAICLVCAHLPHVGSYIEVLVVLVQHVEFADLRPPLVRTCGRSPSTGSTERPGCCHHLRVPCSAHFPITCVTAWSGDSRAEQSFSPTVAQNLALYCVCRERCFTLRQPLTHSNWQRLPKSLALVARSAQTSEAT